MEVACRSYVPRAINFLVPRSPVTTSCASSACSTRRVLKTRYASARCRRLTVQSKASWDGVDKDLGYPADGFSSIAEAVEAIRRGKMIVVVGSEHKEDEGDLLMAASLVTRQSAVFLVCHSTGTIGVPMKAQDLDRLGIPDGIGLTTGVRARDAVHDTILALASLQVKGDDFKRHGHVFPMRYNEGNDKANEAEQRSERPGLTEAAVDLVVMAGLPPVAVLCEVVNDDGSMARLPELQLFAREYQFPIISVANLKLS